MNNVLEKKIERQIRYYRDRGFSVERLADEYYMNKNRYTEAVMEGGSVIVADGGEIPKFGNTEYFYIKKEATRRLLLEKGVGYEK